MGVTKVVVGSTFEKYLFERMEGLKSQYLRSLIAAGTETLNYIRNRSGEASWYDQTGNLRSSTGFVILDEGQIVFQSGFDQVKDGAEGSRIGKLFSERIAGMEQFQHGLVLIVVAGMEYAAYVEAMENKDVLASSKFYANRIVQEIIKQLK